MEKNNLFALAIGVCASIMLSAVALNNSFKSHNLITEGQMKEMMKEYIAQNPKEIMDSVERYRETMVMEMEERMKKALVDSKEMLENYAGDPKIGSQNGKVKLVEFFDYGCVFCKKMDQVVADAMAAHRSDVQLILKSIPFFGEPSKYATKMALAVYKFDSSKYYAFHTALMQSKNPDLVAASDEVLASLGIDKASIKTLMESEAVEEIVQKNIQLAREIGVRGAPAFVIGGELIIGAMEQQTLESKIAAVSEPMAKKDEAQNHQHESAVVITSSSAQKAPSAHETAAVQDDVHVSPNHSITKPVSTEPSIVVAPVSSSQSNPSDSANTNSNADDASAAPVTQPNSGS